MSGRALVLVVIAAAWSGAAEARTGLLAVRGSAKLASELGASIVASLRKQGREVISPTQLRQRLAVNPEVVASLTGARAAIARSERAALYMKKQRAIAAARQAIAQLTVIAGRHHAGTVVGRAQLALGVAALLEPADRTTALVAFRAAFSADPELRPNPDRIPTRTSKLLRRAQESIASPSPPTRDELALLAQLTGIGELLWVAVEPRSDRLEVIALRYDHAEATITGPQRIARPMPGPGGSGKLGADITRLIGFTAPPAATTKLRPQTPPAAVAGLDRTEPHPGGRSSARPWYRRWWVWTLAAGVVAGSAVAVAMAAGSRTERSYAFRFELK